MNSMFHSWRTCDNPRNLSPILQSFAKSGAPAGSWNRLRCLAPAKWEPNGPWKRRRWRGGSPRSERLPRGSQPFSNIGVETLQSMKGKGIDWGLTMHKPVIMYEHHKRNSWDSALMIFE